MKNVAKPLISQNLIESWKRINKKQTLLVLSGMFLAFAILTKVIPLILIPLYLGYLVKQKQVKKASMFLFPLLFIIPLFYAPFTTHSLFPLTRYQSFSQTFEFNSTVFRYIYTFLKIYYLNPKSIALIVDSIVLIGVILYQLRNNNLLKQIIVVMSLYFLLSPISYPWYTIFLTVAVFLYSAQTKNYLLLIPLFVLQGLFMLTYYSNFPGISSYSETTWILHLIANCEFIIFLASTFFARKLFFFAKI